MNCPQLFHRSSLPFSHQFNHPVNLHLSQQGSLASNPLVNPRGSLLCSHQNSRRCNQVASLLQFPVHNQHDSRREDLQNNHHEDLQNNPRGNHRHSQHFNQRLNRPVDHPINPLGNQVINQLRSLLVNLRLFLQCNRQFNHPINHPSNLPVSPVDSRLKDLPFNQVENLLYSRRGDHRSNLLSLLRSAQASNRLPNPRVSQTSDRLQFHQSNPLHSPPLSRLGDRHCSPACNLPLYRRNNLLIVLVYILQCNQVNGQLLNQL